jgi:cytoskeletal protein CcmA (bactofilin family)
MPRHGRRGNIGGAEEAEGCLKPTSPEGRRFADGVQPPTTVIGHGARVRGDLDSSGPIEIHGTLEGDCQTSAYCTVHEGARVLGNITANALVVAGEVEAGLLWAGKVELRASARVVATIRAHVIAIRDGAVYQGQIEEVDAAGGPLFVRDRRE